MGDEFAGLRECGYDSDPMAFLYVWPEDSWQEWLWGLMDVFTWSS